MFSFIFLITEPQNFGWEGVGVYKFYTLLYKKLMYLKNIERLFSKHYKTYYEPFFDAIEEITFKQIQDYNEPRKVLPELIQLAYSVYNFSVKMKAKTFHTCNIDLDRL